MAHKFFRKYWFRKFFYAFRGLFVTLKEEKSMIVHFILSLVFCIVGLSLKISLESWIPLILVFAFVVSTELINTAIENIVDTISFEYNINAQKIKDISAASTLIASIISVIICLLIFIPRIVEIANGNY